MNRKYKDDYELRDVPRKNGRGTRQEAVYTGGYWSYDLPERPYRVFLGLLAAALLVMSALYVVMGLLRTGSMGAGGAAAPYVLLPYVALLLPLGFCWGKLFSLATAGRLLERRGYELWVRGLRSWSVGLVVCAGACCVGGLVYALTHRGGAHAAADLVFAALAAAVAGLCWLMIRIQDRYPCAPVDKSAKKAKTDSEKDV